MAAATPSTALPQATSASTDVPQPKRRGQKWAQRALMDSCKRSGIDLKLRKKEWQDHAFRFTPELITKLARRVAEDSEATGRKLTNAHYVDAAMATLLPKTTDEQMDLAEKFLWSNDAEVPEGKQSTYRVSPEVFAVAAPLSNRLKAAGRARTAYHVYSAVLTAYFEQLEKEDPFPPK